MMIQKYKKSAKIIPICWLHEPSYNILQPIFMHYIIYIFSRLLNVIMHTHTYIYISQPSLYIYIYTYYIVVCVRVLSLSWHITFELSMKIHRNHQSNPARISQKFPMKPGLGTHAVGASEVPISDHAELKERLVGHFGHRPRVVSWLICNHH
jgi:hypothetical protein